MQSLNLNFNRIEFIETNAFINKLNGSRFTNLKYLGLANNLIKELDLLWPLTLPSTSLIVDLKHNQIRTLTNQNKFTYSNEAFNFAMIGDHRYLDATDNALDYLDDDNLLQYGLENATDLKAFLHKISNYDFSQTNGVSTLSCRCPPGGQLVLAWFDTFATTIAQSYPIYKLECQFKNNAFYRIFHYPCVVNKILFLFFKRRI